MKRNILIIGLLIISVLSYAQNYEMDAVNGTTVTTCTGMFYDSGGAFGSYTNGESYSVTFCPSTTGTMIDLDFASFDVGAGASMVVFDGPDNTYNNFGTFSNGGFSPVGMGVAATPTNSSGCLTVQWSSGGSTNMGWEAEVSCIIPCQTVLSTLLSSTPTVSVDGFIDVCPGQTITLVGGGIYPENNLVYNQGNNTSTFVWDFGNGLVDSSGSNVTQIVYDTISGYNINLTVIDTLGCTNTNMLGIRVRVSTAPSFDNTMPSDPVICDGDEVDLFGNVQTTPFEVTADLSLAGTTFLPDGSGASYTTSLVFDAFAGGQTLTNVNNLLSICAVMEHSYLGDLDITLECPNGTVVELKTYPGCGSTYLGEPIDVDANLNPGVGYEYCWSPTPTYGNMNVECGSYSTMPSGSYAPVGTFSDFIGCPLNGAWTIEVTDNLLSDNGFIFSWGINFDPSILPSNFNYEPEIISVDWNVDPWFIVTDNDSDLVIAPTMGMYNYTYSVTDDFGCSYDTTINLEVLPSYMVNFPSDTILCSDATLFLDASNGGQNIGAEYVWHWDFTGDDTISVATDYVTDKPGLFWVEIPNAAPGCGYTDSIFIEYNEMELELGVDIENVCSSSPITLDATTDPATFPSVSYLWSDGSITPTITVPLSGTYSVSVARGSCIETDEITITYDIPLNINLGTEAYLCDGSLLNLDVGYPNCSYIWSTGALSQMLEVSIPGLYTVSVTNACGEFIDQVEVVGIDVPVVDIGGDVTVCYGLPVVLNAETTAPGPDPNYIWSTGEFGAAVAIFDEGTYSVTVTNQCGATIDMMYLTNEFPLVIDLGNDTTICLGESLILDPGTNGSDFFWSTAANTPTITVDTQDSYSVDVTNSCGTYTDFINVYIDALDIELGPDTLFCSGGVVTFDLQNPGSSYLWSNGANTQVVDINQAGTYSVTVISPNGCTDIDEVEITEFQLEMNLGNDTAICQGDILTLETGLSGYPHSWSTGESSPSIEVVDAGMYSVTVQHFCGNLNDGLVVDVLPLPVIDFGSDTIFLSGNATVNLDAGNPGSEYLWSNGEQTQIIEVGVEGNYYVTVTDPNGCSNIGEVVLAFKVGITNLEFANDVDLFPNPTSNILNIVSENERLKSIEIYNSIGKKVFSNLNPELVNKIDISNLSEGIYFARIISLKGNNIVKPVSVVR